MSNSINTSKDQEIYNTRQSQIGVLMGMWMAGNELGAEIVCSPIIQILRGKLNQYLPTLTNVIPNHLLAYAALCTDFNPGYSQIFLKEVLLHNKDSIKLCLKYNMPLSQQCVIYSIIDWEYPSMSNQTFANRIKRKYKGQQTSQGNLMDTAQWWQEVL